MATVGGGDSKLYSRVDVLEHTVSRVETVVTDFAKEVREWMRHQQSQPRPIPFKEIIATAACTLGLCWGILQFLDDRAEKALAVYKYRIEQLERYPVSTGMKAGINNLP